METILELLNGMAHSTTEGKFGVAAIFIYFIVIVAVACYRIKQNLEHDHH